MITVLIVLLIAGVCFWWWGVKQWSGEQLDRREVADGIELIVGLFEHPDTDPVTIRVVKAIVDRVEFQIDFSGPNPDVIRSDFIATGRGQQAGAMINGGYFDASLQPVGLVIKDGQTLSGVSQQAALSGVLAIVDQKDMLLIPRSSYRKDSMIQSAIQAGPFIIEPGGKRGIHSEDLKKAERTAIGKTVSGRVVFISTTPCTLYQFSELLTTFPEVLGMARFDRVLNLDGGPSSGLYLHGLEEYLVVPETKVPNRILMLSR